MTHAPLSGCEVVVTRASHQQTALCERLVSLGASPISAPMIKLASPPQRDHEVYQTGVNGAPPCVHFEDAYALLCAQADRELNTQSSQSSQRSQRPQRSQSSHKTQERVDWIIFTSANAARRADALWRDHSHDGRSHHKREGLAGLLSSSSSRSSRPRVLCVGSSTKRALESLGVTVDDVPREFHAEGVLALLSDHDLRGARVLIPRALRARELLPHALRERGAEVMITPVYETVGVALSQELKSSLLTPPEPLTQGRALKRYLTFTSNSTLERFVEQLNEAELAQLKRWARVIVIGPIVARAALHAGLPTRRVAEPHTIDGLIDALIDDALS